MALLPPCSHHKRRAGQHHSSLLPLRARRHHPSKNSYRRRFVSYYALQVLLQLVTLITVCFHTLLRLSLSLTSPSSCPGFPPYPSAFIIASPGSQPLPCLAVRYLTYFHFHYSSKRPYLTMASATATATMAAAGFNKRSSSSAASSLQTPASGTFPSELRSPMVASPSLLRQDDALKTPITPPSAYLDFLKSMSPALMSPLPTGTSSHFKFPDKVSNRISEIGVDRPLHSPATSQPALSRNTSFESNASSTTSSTESAISHSSASTTSRSKPQSPRITIPPSPFAMPAPRSSRTPRRLHIPQSPFTPALSSAHSTPYSGTPLSAAPWSATYSPRDVDPEANGKPGKVSVPQVVTRTVTYSRTPLEPAPRGKRRKLDAPSVRTSILEDCLAEAEERAASQEEPKEDKFTKEEVAEVKRETSEAPTEVATSIPSPPKDA